MTSLKASWEDLTQFVFNAHKRLFSCKSSRSLHVFSEIHEHVDTICKKGYVQLKKIHQTQKYLDNHVPEQIVYSFITSDIDYCNSVLYGAPKGVVQKLQRL